MSAILGESALADDYYRQAIGAYTVANQRGCGYDCQSVAIYRRGEPRGGGRRCRPSAGRG